MCENIGCRRRLNSFSIIILLKTSEQIFNEFDIVTESANQTNRYMTHL